MSSTKTDDQAGTVPKPLIRGAIRESISTSTDNLFSGEAFSVFVRIQNPFEVPLTIHRVSTFLPQEFIDLNHQDRAKAAEAAARDLAERVRSKGLDLALELGKQPSWWRRMGRGSRLASIDSSGGPAVASAMGEGSAPGPRPTRFDDGMLESMGPLDEAGKAALRDKIRDEAAGIEGMLRSPTPAATAGTVLQPGNSTTRAFRMRSKSALALKPCMYRLSIEIEYELNGVKNIDTLEHAIPIRASMISMMLGSLLGALLGTLASGGLNKMTAWANAWTALKELVPSLVLAAVSIVLFARKKDVQPIIAIEDFWGGLSIGFLVGYSGPKVLSALFEVPKGAG